MRACVTKCWFCHIRRRLARRLMANAATPPKPAAGFAGGRFAPLWQPFHGSGGTIPPPLCRSAPLRPLHRCGLLSGRLNKTRILLPQPAVFRRRCGVGSFASLTPCRLRRHILAALAGGVRSNRPSLSAAVRKAHPQEHIIASHTCRYGSIAAAHGQCCTSACTVSLRKFFLPCAELHAPWAVF